MRPAHLLQKAYRLLAQHVRRRQKSDHLVGIVQHQQRPHTIADHLGIRFVQRGLGAYIDDRNTAQISHHIDSRIVQLDVLRQHLCRPGKTRTGL